MCKLEHAQDEHKYSFEFMKSMIIGSGLLAVCGKGEGCH